MKNPAVIELAYIELGVSSIPDWQKYAENVLGVAQEQTDDGVQLRYDQEAWRISLKASGEDDILCAGFKVASKADIRDIGIRLKSQGVEVTEGTQEQCLTRGVDEMLICFDPDGLRIELFVGERSTSSSFVSPRGVSGFVTVGMGLGHIVLSVSDEAKALAFYMDGLGFLLSDHIVVGPGDRQLNLTFLHCNPRHHTLAIMPAPLPKRVHHIMLQVAAIDDVGAGLDAARQSDVPISLELGKHTNDKMISFYMQNPSGFDVEYGYGGVEIDDSNWQTTTYNAISIWGHTS